MNGPCTRQSVQKKAFDGVNAPSGLIASFVLGIERSDVRRESSSYVSKVADTIVGLRDQRVSLKDRLLLAGIYNVHPDLPGQLRHFFENS